eukprot:TRINITY_DN95523_c0_g1_i1.p1 TRINITY_DN95523_c0_g1~~TRINITY_DN95523_c0_g1_i1.p1  ORF type:complete len:433 (+),score=71.02 TRINITY_DN95523_c0_g1_i1:118-1416(+)
MSSNKLTLYGAFPSFLKFEQPIRPRHFRPQWAMEEIGVPHDIVSVDLFGGQRNPTNPLGEIPSLVDGDFTLTESCAITEYIAKKENAAIYPFKTLQQEARCNQMALFATSTLENTIFKAFFNAPTAPFGNPDKKIHDGAVDSWKKKVAPALATFLGSKPYFEGEFTVVDIFIAYPLCFAKAIGLVNETDTPTLAAYMARIEARPGFKKALAYRPKPKLYGFHLPDEKRLGRPRSARVLWVAQELGVPLEWISINPLDGSTAAPEYRALNPTGEIPTLVDGDLVLTESVAISNYLAETYNKNGMWPESAAQRALTQKISYFVATTGETALTGMFRHSEFFPAPLPKDEKVFEECKQKWATKVGPTLEAWLGDKLYMLGDTFTVVDCTVGYAIHFAHVLGVLSDFPKLKAYHKRVCLDRGAWANAWDGPEKCGC